jgi:hypothetical protein
MVALNVGAPVALDMGSPLTRFPASSVNWFADWVFAIVTVELDCPYSLVKVSFRPTLKPVTFKT